MIANKERSLRKSKPTDMDVFDKQQLNLILKYVQRYVIVMFDDVDAVPEEYVKLIDHLKEFVPTTIQDEPFAIGSTPFTIGYYIYQTAFGAYQMSLNKPTELKNIVDEILVLFVKYRQISPAPIKLDGSGSSSPATSTLSEVSGLQLYSKDKNDEISPPKEI